MKKFKDQLKEEQDLDELIGYLKGKYNTIAEVKTCERFKSLSVADKEYVIDELKSEFMEAINYDKILLAIDKDLEANRNKYEVEFLSVDLREFKGRILRGDIKEYLKEFPDMNKEFLRFLKKKKLI
jgi:hypothetical protein